MHQMFTLVQGRSNQYLSPRDVATLLVGSFALGGFAILYWSRELSLRYNTWTSRLRERRRGLSPPPTPEMREMNEKILMWILRFVGALMVAQALVLTYELRNM